jgi:2-dehydro-3-deoxygluconokinase
MKGDFVEDLKLRSDTSGLDFLALGAIVHRLDPGLIPFRKARAANIHVSGGEYNVAAGLSDCFELQTGIATAMVNYGIGELVQNCVREMGVTPFYRWFEYDGVRGPNIATVYSDLGYGIRSPVVFYNRSNEAAALLKPGDFDWDKIFGDGVRWFHSGGIFASLSETTSELVIEGMQAAKGVGAINSFDLNYRAKLWAPIGGPEKAQKVIRLIASNVDVLIGNEEDLQMGLGIPGPEVASKSKLDHGVFFKMMDRVIDQFPNIKLVATTLREVQSSNRHIWRAVMWYDGEQYVSPTYELDVLDRIGGGDGFATGLIYGFMSKRKPEEALRLGLAHGALVTTFPGDVTMAKLSEVEALSEGGSARVQR